MNARAAWMFHGRAYAGGRFASLFRNASLGTPCGTPIPHSTPHRVVRLVSSIVRETRWKVSNPLRRGGPLCPSVVTDFVVIS
jgi:hypothetical protein